MSWQKDSACLRLIFSDGGDSRPEFLKIPGKLSPYKDLDVEIYPGMIQLKSPGDQSEPLGGGTRGKVVRFTKGSRLRMIKYMAQVEEQMSFWQTFTFADDTMIDLSTHERARISSDVLKRFKEHIERKFNLCGLWKREWEPRKSGQLRGEVIPHFHMMFHRQGLTEKQFLLLAPELARIWVELTRTNDPRALKVATHKDSYEWLDNWKKAQFYIAKYCAKEQEFSLVIDEDESIGRYWGRIGKLTTAAPVELRLTDYEKYLFKRLLRRYCKKGKNRSMRNKIQAQVGFLLIGSTTIRRMFEYIREKITDEAMSRPLAGLPI